MLGARRDYERSNQQISDANRHGGCSERRCGVVWAEHLRRGIVPRLWVTVGEQSSTVNIDDPVFAKPRLGVNQALFIRVKIERGVGDFDD